MVVRKFVRIPTRRETLATRKLRARLARERQGPDGKWETNKRKREARSVKKKCTKLQNVFERVRAQQVEEETVTLDVAGGLLLKLAKVTKAAALMQTLQELEALAVTSSVLRQRQLVDGLLGAAKRCRKGKDARVLALVAQWRRMLDDARPPKETKTGDTSGSVTSSSSSPLKTAQSPRYVTPLRPKVVRPSWKLGKLFGAMRNKQAVAEAASISKAQGLTMELQSCGDSKTLRALLPRLQELTVTGRVLQQVRPKLLESLESSAKRCRMSKHGIASTLLANWRELLKTAAPQQAVRKRITGKRKIGEVVPAQSSQPEVKVINHERAQETAILPIKDQALPSKQQKITSFLFGNSAANQLASVGA